MKHYYEVKPGIDAARYLVSYGFLTMLSRQARKRQHRMFAQLSGSIDRHVLSEGYFEKGVLSLIEELCSHTGHRKRMVDVGANIGSHTVGLSGVFEQIAAIEPHPVLFKILEANTLLNGLSHVTCYNVGLASEEVSGTLVESPVEHGLSSVRERSQLPPETFGLSSEEFGTEFTVSLISTDEFLRTFAADLDRTFIKIDVEGMEEEILHAMTSVLNEYRPLVGFEWFTAAQPDLGNFVARLEHYELWGIRVHDAGRNYLRRALRMLVKGRSYTLEPIDLGKLDAVYTLAFMIPKDRIGSNFPFRTAGGA